MNGSHTSPGSIHSLLLALVDKGLRCLDGVLEVMWREGDTQFPSDSCTILKLIMTDFSLLTDERAEWQGLAGFLGVLGVMRAEGVKEVVVVMVEVQVVVVAVAAFKRAGVRGGLSGKWKPLVAAIGRCKGGKGRCRDGTGRG